MVDAEEMNVFKLQLLAELTLCPNVMDKIFTQSPYKLGPFINDFYELFTRWIREIYLKDLGNLVLQFKKAKIRTNSFVRRLSSNALCWLYAQTIPVC